MIRLMALLFGLAGAGCAPFHPVPMNSDPNQEAHDRMEQKNDEASVVAFIAAHPELDSQTRKELREGKISREEALRRHPPK